ncbi:MAG: polysaccharide deacetylase family protein [Gemmatimonadaceae bacterium]
MTASSGSFCIGPRRSPVRAPYGTLTGGLKAATELLLLRGGPAAVARRLHNGRAVVLAYHNVVPDESAPAGDRSLHITRRQFASHLDALERHYRVVPLEEILSPAGDDRRPAVAITFDDAYHGAVTLGVGELLARRMPATIFVAPALLGMRAPWWDALATGADGLPGEVRDHAIHDLGGSDEEIRRWAIERGLVTLEVLPSLRISDEAGLHRAVESHPALRLASHTWSHRNLTRLAAGELRAELVRPLRWLRERFTAVVPWLSYPFGLSTATVLHEAERAGYCAALRVAGGHIPRHVAARYSLPRFSVAAGTSAAGFELRLAGLSNVVRRRSVRLSGT